MKLSPADADHFFKLMWGLQNYVNQQLQLIPSVGSVDDYAALPVDEKMPVRQALYRNPKLIDQFVTDNPLGLSNEELALVAAWSRFVEGEFYIERNLKKYTIFIDSNDVVYGVLGLHDDLNEMIHKSRLPYLVRAVLLPFKGKIVYDGLLQGSNIIFGGGIKDELKQIYLLAKEAGLVIENLDHAPTVPATAAKAQVAANTSQAFSEILRDMAAQAKSLRGGKGQPAFNSPIFSLLKACVELGQTAVDKPENAQQLLKALSKTERAFLKAENAIHRHL
jgi:hypothetical protein